MCAFCEIDQCRYMISDKNLNINTQQHYMQKLLCNKEWIDDTLQISKYIMHYYNDLRIHFNTMFVFFFYFLHY